MTKKPEVVVTLTAYESHALLIAGCNYTGKENWNQAAQNRAVIKLQDAMRACGAIEPIGFRRAPRKIVVT